MSPEVAHTLRGVLAEIPERGTARRLAGVFQAPDGTPIPIAGKTGSGDARFDTFSRGGQRITSRPTGRTAVFVFALGESHFGVITAMVPGAASGSYSFTSALPVTVLAMLAPALTEHLDAANDASIVAHRVPHRGEPGAETPTLTAVADSDSEHVASAERRVEPALGAGPGRTRLTRLP